MPKDILGIFRGDRIFMWSKWKTESDIIVLLQLFGLSKGIVSSKKTFIFLYSYNFIHSWDWLNRTFPNIWMECDLRQKHSPVHSGIAIETVIMILIIYI